MSMFGMDLPELIRSVGYLGIFFITFAESGLFFGFFLPGDSLLFTAGFLASTGFFKISWLIPIVVIGAIGGDSAGFWTGKKFGSWLMNKRDTFFFQKNHLEAARKFYDKHGGKTLILARFMPAVRTFAPIVAGMAEMNYADFIRFNFIGGLVWGVGMPFLGYFLGSLIPDVDRYLLPIVATIIVLSVAPGIYHFAKKYRSQAANPPRDE